jgi:serine/threonine protein kinase
MSSARSEEAERIFFATIDLDPDERDAFIRSACAGDTELQREVEALLRQADASDSYFEKLSGRLGIDKLRDGAAHRQYQAASGQQFGQYRLTSLLGSGGMGEVWRAERSDGRFEGEVAVKLLTRTGSGAALRRFDREANYLAKLTHAGIARLIDAGVGPNEVP